MKSYQTYKNLDQAANLLWQTARLVRYDQGESDAYQTMVRASRHISQQTSDAFGVYWNEACERAMCVKHS